jgi:hypothetical protein
MASHRRMLRGTQTGGQSLARIEHPRLIGISRLMELLRILDTKLAGTDIRVDCLLSYADPEEMGPTPTAGFLFPLKSSGRHGRNGVAVNR